MEKILQAMMKRFPLFIGMGVMIVMIAVGIGAVNAVNAADYYSVDIAAREASVELAQVRAGIESTIVWLPYFKFLGLAMILGGIVMALGVINMRLQILGKAVMASVPEEVRVPMPSRPASIFLMRMFMILGMLVIVIGFFISLSVASTASAVFSNPITVIDAAPAGPVLLAGLASVHSAEAWLEAFKFAGVAFLFMGIVNGLASVVYALRFQWNAIPQIAKNLQTSSPQAVPDIAPEAALAGD